MKESNVCFNVSTQDFQHALKNDMIITGGHFTLTDDGSSLNQGTINSFEISAQLYASNRNLISNLGFGILINDIGSVCSSTVCHRHAVPSRDTFVFPDPYLSILSVYKIKTDEITIFWEKHIRNRAKKLLNGQIFKKNPSIFYVENEGYVYRHQDKPIEIVLTRYNRNDKRGTPACPLIMSAYCMEHKRLGYKSSLNFYYIGEDNYMNVGNHFVIEKGCFLASCFDENMGKNKNVYLSKDGVIKNFQ